MSPTIVQRVLTGLVAMASFLTAAFIWVSPAAHAEQVRLAIAGPLGAASIRADIGGMFLAIGIFAAMAAWRRSRFWAGGALILVLCALVGRVVDLLAGGFDPVKIPPILVEAITIAILAWGWASWKEAPEGL